MTATEELKLKVDTLPEPLAREVLDFLMFVADRHRQEPGRNAPPSYRGAFKGRISGSDAYASGKRTEKQLER